jgi:alcohol dehydrogenase, propanol-preferring
MTGMQALRLTDWHRDATLQEVDRPTPGPGEVVIQVGGAGACHSDLHLMHDFSAGQVPWSPPFTLGHEHAGWVHELGEGVAGLNPGDPVAVVGAWGCGRCARCRAGRETYCEDPTSAPVPGGGGGLGLDGGMAEYLLVPDPRFLVPLPEGLSPAMAAPLTDAALTPYHAVRRSLAKLTPGCTAVVIGAGGLGHMAVQILSAITAARVIVVDPKPEALQLAKTSGADLVLAPGEDVVDQIRGATQSHGADVVLDFVGSDSSLVTAAACVRQLGDLTIVGIAGGTLPVSFFALPYECSVQTTYWGNRSELIEVLDLAARGRLQADLTTFPLEEAAAVYGRLAAQDITGRAVITPFDTYTPQH